MDEPSKRRHPRDLKPREYLFFIIFFVGCTAWMLANQPH